MPPDFLERAFSSLGLPETVAMLVGGFLFGAVVMHVAGVVAEGVVTAGFVGLIAGMLGLVFFISRGFALYFEDSNLWPRNVGFAILWIVYSASMSFGIAARKRL